MKTLIAVPCMDMVYTDFMKSLLYLRKGEGVDVCFRENSLIYESRNLLSLTAIEKGYDYVMWFDSDMVFIPDTMQKLMNDIAYLEAQGHAPQMITGVYVKRRGTPVPVLYSTLEVPAVNKNGKMEKRITDYIDYPESTLFPVAGCGFGGVLTKTSLLKEVWDKFGPAFNPYPWAGEDISFCYRVNQLGKDRIWCDSGIQYGHVGLKIYCDELPAGGEDHE